jgi:hypothetical protein
MPEITENQYKCIQCLQIKKLSDFNKNRLNKCRNCINKEIRERRKTDINFNYKSRLRLHLRREKIKYDTKFVNRLWQEIKNKLGLPPKCSFNDEFCGNVTTDDNKSFPIQIGHQTPPSKGGKITDIDNLIWVCNRHNMMMSDRTVEEFYKMVNSMIKRL